MLASEIILNPDNSVYHLKLKNGDIPQKVVTVGDPDRIDLFLTWVDQVYFDRQSREIRTLKARIGSEDFLFISTGMGTDNIDIVLNELYLAYQWDLSKREILAESLKPLQVLRLGTSGTLRSDIPVDSILMSEAALGFDYLMYFYQWDDFRSLAGLEAFPKPYFAWADGGMADHFRKSVDYTGITVTANGFYGPQGRNVPLASKNPGWLKALSALSMEGLPITNLEMETAGIYGLGKLLGMQCLSLSAILANRMEHRFSTKPEQTIKKMITRALEEFSALR